MQAHSPWGMVIGTVVAVVAAAVFGIPTGILASGFESKVQERQEAKRAAAAERARTNWRNAMSVALKRSGTSAVAAFEGINGDSDGSSGKHARHFKKYVALDQVKGDATWQGSLYNFIHGHTRAGKYAEYFITALIVANVAAFMAGTTEAVAASGANDQPNGALWVFEALSVAVFTAELVAGLVASGQDPRYRGVKGKLSYLVSFYVLIDLISVVPFYVDLGLANVDLRATTFMRALRLIRLLRSESYRKSFGAFEAVIRANSDELAVTGFVAAISWLFFSVAMYYSERNNPCNAVVCGDANPDCDDIAGYYQSVPDAMWITLLNLSGEVPIADYTPLGKVLVGFMGLFAVGFFGIPIGILSSGFGEWAAEQGERGEGNAGDDDDGDDDAANAGTVADEPLLGGGGAAPHLGNYLGALKPATAADDFLLEDGDFDSAGGGAGRQATSQQKLHAFLNGKGTGGTLFVRFVFFLIFATVIMAIIQTVDAPWVANADSTLENIERACVIFFSLEYAMRLYTAPESPQFSSLLDVFSFVPDYETHANQGCVLVRLRYIFSFFSIVDLLAIVPGYMAWAGAIPAGSLADELLRIFRILRLLALDRYSSSLALMSTVLSDNKLALSATGFIALLFWLVFSTLLFLTESQNFVDEAGMNMSSRFSDVPNALQYTAIFLTGDFPLVAFSFWGRIVNVANVLVAVGVVGIPAGIIADGFTDALQEARDQKASAKANAAAAANSAGVVGAAGAAGADADNADDVDDDDEFENKTESCCFGKGYDEPQAINGSILQTIHNFNAGNTRGGLWTSRFLIVLIILNVVAVVIESLESLNVTQQARDWWNVFEYFSVGVFTIEYVLRIAGAAYNPACGYSRLVYATTFIGIVDLLSIAPFFIQLVYDASNGGGEDQTTAEIFRVFRIFRLLELEHFLEAFTLLDDVFNNCKGVLKATGVVALVIWVGGGALFWLCEQDTIANIPEALFYTAVFLGGEWALCDFGNAGKVLCVFFCVVGIALFGTFVGFLADSFGEVLEERGEKREASKTGDADAGAAAGAGEVEEDSRPRAPSTKSEARIL